MHTPNQTRRRLLQGLGAGAALGAVGLPRFAFAKTKARVVVIGGGYGGATTAKYLRLLDPNIHVTLIEKKAAYVSCPMSNEFLGGERDLASITFDYRGLAGHGVDVVQALVTDIDAAKKTVTAEGRSYAYDKLVMSPGIDFRWDALEGYDATVAATIPHAWQAGPQTVTLRKQLEAMPDGGVVYIAPPSNPFRCPPGPYERASQIAHYLKHHKPKSKIIILDAKDKFSKQGLFTAGWKENYGDMIEWVPGSQGGMIEAVDAKTNTLIAQLDEHKGDVLNVIPPQKAAALAFAAGLTNAKGWCPINQKTFESDIHKDIHVIGDSCIAGKMPKSGYAANSQGKVCAQAITAAVNGQAAPEPSYVNTCYSIIAPQHGISVAAVYRLKGGQIVGVKGAGGLSPSNASPYQKAMEAQYGRSWFDNITGDMFG